MSQKTPEQFIIDLRQRWEICNQALSDQRINFALAMLPNEDDARELSVLEGREVTYDDLLKRLNQTSASIAQFKEKAYLTQAGIMLDDAKDNLPFNQISFLVQAGDNLQRAGYTNNIPAGLEKLGTSVADIKALLERAEERAGKDDPAVKLQTDTVRQIFFAPPKID